MPLEHLITFAVLAFALIVVPGPSVLFVVGRALTVGRRAALATVLGNAAGEYLQLVLVALGLGLVVERSEVVFSIVKLVGAGYLVWLGIEAIRRRRALAEALATPAPSKRGRAAVREGFIVGATNPKTTIFFAAVLPQFVEPGRAPIPVQMLALGLVFLVIALASDSVWAFAAGTARDWLARSRRRRESLHVGSGLIMIGLAVKLAFSDRH
jgi:threonine/homoserine/homoserine lactone efflux protein